MWENTKQGNLFQRKLRGKTNKYLDYIPSFPFATGLEKTFFCITKMVQKLFHLKYFCINT